MIKITPNIFIAVKTLLESGETNANIAKYLKISETSVKHIKAAENYDEYKAIIAAIVAKKNEKRQAEREAQAAEAAKAAKAVGAVPASSITPPAPPVQVVEHRQSIQVSATHYMETKLDIMIDLLKGISAKPAAIIDDLYGTGKKEGA